MMVAIASSGQCKRLMHDKCSNPSSCARLEKFAANAIGGSSTLMTIRVRRTLMFCGFCSERVKMWSPELSKANTIGRGVRGLRKRCGRSARAQLQRLALPCASGWPTLTRPQPLAAPLRERKHGNLAGLRVASLLFAVAPTHVTGDEMSARCAVSRATAS